MKSREGRKWRGSLGVLVAFVAMLGVGCFAPPPTQPASVKWLVYGDSLSEESQSYLASYGTVAERFYGGTAPCNWLANLGTDADSFAPREVLLQFIGNLTPCISGRDPQAAYTDDLKTIATFWKDRGVPVVMVISPKTPTDSLAWARQAELNVAAELGLLVNDAGLSVSRNGDFTYFLACQSQEAVAQGCGSEVAGQIRVRDLDGVHFGTSNPDHSYSSGASRFAAAEAQS